MRRTTITATVLAGAVLAGTAALAGPSAPAGAVTGAVTAVAPGTTTALDDGSCTIAPVTQLMVGGVAVKGLCPNDHLVVTERYAPTAVHLSSTPTTAKALVTSTTWTPDVTGWWGYSQQQNAGACTTIKIKVVDTTHAWHKTFSVESSECVRIVTTGA